MAIWMIMPSSPRRSSMPFEATLTPAYFDLQNSDQHDARGVLDEEHWGFFSLARVTKRLSSAPIGV